MKFHCYIEIHDRILSVCSQRRSQSILAFTKKSVKDDDVYLYLQTRQNKQGIKYQIVNNVKQVFTKFIADGKVTIRLTQPCHDLIIQSDSIQLKSFLHILNQIINRHSQHDELGTLPHLQQLLLSQNNLGKSPKSKWTWLEQTAIKHNLHFLDISNNLLTELPTQIKNLNALVHLKVSQNALMHLPHNIRTLRNLKILDVARNRLLYLPVTITYLRLQLLDVTENPFMESSDIKNVCVNDSAMTVKMTSLVEWSAKSILKSRITYDASIIPYTLVDYLDEAKCCYLCKTTCFDCYVKKLIYVPLPCAEIKKSMCTAFIFEAYFCSLFCANNILCKSK
ncbi:LLR1 protein, partial [Acromyrmex heyeri]